MEVVLACMSGRNVFAVLSTGYGKSLCFACLPIIFDLVNECEYDNPKEPSIVIVVSPLVAIINDQVGT